jgi:hypothetical protein
VYVGYFLGLILSFRMLSLLARMARTLATLLVIPSLLAAGLSQNASKDTMPAKEQAHKSAAKSQPDHELQSILDLAASVPPEFEADVLLHLASSGKVNGRVAKLQLLKKAFDAAALAQQPIERKALVGSDTDTRSGFLAIAFQLDLDRLSLESRAVNEVSRLDPARALIMFEEMRLPTLSPLGCEESLAYDPSVYYRTLENVARNSFTSKQRANGRRLAWLDAYLSNLQSHSQVAPVARLLAESDLSAAELEETTTRFASSLQQLGGDERSLAAATVDSGESNLLGAMAHLVATLRAKKVPAAPLVAALREYLVSNFRTVSCGEAIADKPGRSIPPAISEFNDSFRAALQESQLSPILDEEIKGAKISGKAVYYPLWQTEESKHLLEGVQRLRFGERVDNPLTQAERSTSEWSTQATEFITHLNSWNGNDEPESDFFHEKCILYQTFIELITTPQDRSNALSAFLAFMEQNSFQQASRIEWFWHAKSLLAGYRAPDYHQQVLRTFLSSRDTILSLYARVEIYAPSQLDGDR